MEENGLGWGQSRRWAAEGHSHTDSFFSSPFLNFDGANFLTAAVSAQNKHLAGKRGFDQRCRHMFIQHALQPPYARTGCGWGVGGSEADQCTDVHFQTLPLILGGRPTHAPIPAIKNQSLAVKRATAAGLTWNGSITHTVRLKLTPAWGAGGAHHIKPSQGDFRAPAASGRVIRNDEGATKWSYPLCRAQRAQYLYRAQTDGKQRRGLIHY